MYGKSSVSFEIPSTIRGSVTTKQHYLLGWTDCATYDHVFFISPRRRVRLCVAALPDVSSAQLRPVAVVNNP